MLAPEDEVQRRAPESGLAAAGRDGHLDGIAGATDPPRLERIVLMDRGVRDQPERPVDIRGALGVADAGGRRLGGHGVAADLERVGVWTASVHVQGEARQKGVLVSGDGDRENDLVHRRGRGRQASREGLDLLQAPNAQRLAGERLRDRDGVDVQDLGVPHDQVRAGGRDSGVLDLRDELHDVVGAGEVLAVLGDHLTLEQQRHSVVGDLHGELCLG